MLPDLSPIGANFFLANLGISNFTEYFRIATVWILEIRSGLCLVLSLFAASCENGASPLHFVAFHKQPCVPCLKTLSSLLGKAKSFNLHTTAAGGYAEDDGAIECWYHHPRFLLILIVGIN